ncbi:MAG: deoxyribonuclease IV, partial [Coriobacteriia bacterium]|nr:deoxyribonuclease IV [Coriobacteriia bacterium]
YEKSVEALADELVRGSIIEAEGVNTHLGNVVDGDQTAAVKRAARAIERAFDIADRACEKLGIVCSTRLILENTAGAGTTYGSTVTELFDVINETKVADERLGICIDTCHAWAAGYDVSSAEGWTEIIDEIVNVGALGLWRFAHANDCKFDRGSKKDRHAWIGEGEIGFKGFKILLHLGEKHSELESMPVITELPGEMPEKDIINIEALKALRQG